MRRAKDPHATAEQLRKLTDEAIERLTGKKGFDPTVGEWLDQWLVEMKGTVSDRTLIVYTKDICVFKEFLGVEGINTKLRLLQKDTFRSFRDKLVADGRSPTTVNNRLGILLYRFGRQTERG